MIDEATLVLCADAAGSIEAMLDETVEYAETRKQFGQPIGAFQVLQHRMADMLMSRSQSVSLTYRCGMLSETDPRLFTRMASAAKVFVGKAARSAAHSAVQIHGGIGITDEISISRHFRRIEMFNLQFGSIDEHLTRYADLLDEYDWPMPVLAGMIRSWAFG